MFPLARRLDTNETGSLLMITVIIVIRQQRRKTDTHTQVISFLAPTPHHNLMPFQLGLQQQPEILSRRVTPECWRFFGACCCFCVILSAPFLAHSCTITLPKHATRQQTSQNFSPAPSNQFLRVARVQQAACAVYANFPRTSRGHLAQLLRPLLPN